MANHSNEKPVRIVPNDKIKNFSKKLSVGIEGALNFILSPEDNITITAFEPFLMPVSAYINAYKKKSILIKIFLENDFSGELYLFFELKTAIALAGKMRQVPSPAINEKLASEIFDAQDLDSFGELGNQLCGILDRIFRDMTSKKIHLRMDFNKKVYPDEAITISSFLDMEEYAVLLGAIKLPQYGDSKLTMLLPRSLYETMLRLEIKLENISPQKVFLYSGNKKFIENMSKALNTRRSSLVELLSPEDLFDILDTPNLCCICIDLGNITFPLSVSESIFFKRLANSRTLQQKNFVLTYANATPENLQILIAMGIKGASTMNVATDFLPWAQAYIGAAQKK